MRSVLFGCMAAAAMLLAACASGSGGTSSGSNGAGSSANSLSITGSPMTAITAGQSYSFTPTVSGASGAESFSIANKPAWATFDTSTGTLTGTPADANAGTYLNIRITVSSGGNSASLSSFTIAVAHALTTNGTATLSWNPPTQNTDGTALTDLTGYRVYYGQSSGSLTQTVAINTVGMTSYVITGLTQGTWYFAIRAVNAAGVESDLSNIASKTI